jgi:hypothetical protein
MTASALHQVSAPKYIPMSEYGSSHDRHRSDSQLSCVHQKWRKQMARGSWYQFLGSSAEDIQAELRWRRIEHGRKMAHELTARHLAKQHGF